MSSVFFGGGKGGTGKTTTTHLACLGAILRNQPAIYVLTDPDRDVRAEGRPYGVLDGRLPINLAQILSNNHNSLDGWLFIDGGGSRTEFDKEMHKEVDLCFLPFCASQEDVDSVIKDLQRLPNAIAWPAAWTTNAFAERAAQKYLDQVLEAFPGRVILPPISFVNSASELLSKSLDSPSTPTRQLGRKVFGIIEDWFIDNIDMAREPVVETVPQQVGQRR